MDAANLAFVIWKNKLQIWGAVVNRHDDRWSIVNGFVTNRGLFPDAEVEKLRDRVDDSLRRHGLRPQLKDISTGQVRGRLMQLYSNEYVARELRLVSGCPSPEDVAFDLAERSAAAGADSARAAADSAKAARRMFYATVVLAIGTLVIVGLRVYELWWRATPLPAAAGGGDARRLWQAAGAATR